MRIEDIDVEKTYADIAFRASPVQDAPLKKLYEYCCKEYVWRLCNLWEVHPEEAWWVDDRIGTELCIADAPWGLGMDEIIYIVENKVDFKAFMEWWDFVEKEISNGEHLPRINFRSWFEMNARPKDLEK